MGFRSSRSASVTNPCRVPMGAILVSLGFAVGSRVCQEPTQLGRDDGHSRRGRSRDGRRSRSRIDRRGRGARRGGRWSRTRVNEGSASGSGTPPMGAGGVGRPSPGPGPSPSSSPRPGSEPRPWKSTNLDDAISRIPHTSPSQNSGPATCSPSGARIATRAGSTIAITTPANRSQNPDRRHSEQANTTLMRPPIRQASNESTSTTFSAFMPQSYHRPKSTETAPADDSLCDDSTLWADRRLGFERQRAPSLPWSGDPHSHRPGRQTARPGPEPRRASRYRARDTQPPGSLLSLLIELEDAVAPPAALLQTSPSQR